jgi:glycosyltransferase involved in cell wall biosynthesis
MHDPDDVSWFAKAILEVLTNDGLARQMSGKGIKRAAEFTWSKTAAATLAVYEHAMQQGN